MALVSMHETDSLRGKLALLLAAEGKQLNEEQVKAYNEQIEAFQEYARKHASSKHSNEVR